VVAVDQPGAGAGGVPEEDANEALVARECAPGSCVVDPCVHDRSLPKTVPVHSAGMDVVVAQVAEPQQVPWLVVAAL
jgi:hypothetical protein